MGKYKQLYSAVYGVFASTLWTGQNIPTYPMNFNIPSGVFEYIRVDVVSGSPNNAAFPMSVAGQLIIDIFTSAGQGIERARDIADILDAYLAGKVLKASKGSVQLQESVMTLTGIDKNNPSLHRAKYTISFNYYGV